LFDDEKERKIALKMIEKWMARLAEEVGALIRLSSVIWRQALNNERN
jgi:hypothetical protein